MYIIHLSLHVSTSLIENILLTVKKHGVYICRHKMVTVATNGMESTKVKVVQEYKGHIVLSPNFISRHYLTGCLKYNLPLKNEVHHWIWQSKLTDTIITRNIFTYCMLFYVAYMCHTVMLPYFTVRIKLLARQEYPHYLRSPRRLSDCLPTSHMFATIDLGWN